MHQQNEKTWDKEKGCRRQEGNLNISAGVGSACTMNKNLYTPNKRTSGPALNKEATTFRIALSGRKGQYGYTSTGISADNAIKLDRRQPVSAAVVCWTAVKVSVAVKIRHVNMPPCRHIKIPKCLDLCDMPCHTS